MIDDEKDSEGEKEEFIFDDLEKPDFNKYEGLKYFDFGEHSEEPDYSKYDKLEEFKFGKSSQPILNRIDYDGLMEFEFEGSFQVKDNREQGISDSGNYVTAGGKAVHAREFGNGGMIYSIQLHDPLEYDAAVASIDEPGELVMPGEAVTPSATFINVGSNGVGFTTNC
ncbi:MAG: hypothetical protein CEE42_10185, partial [Promethearchaeota archaeon Loki_b31]